MRSLRLHGSMWMAVVGLLGAPASALAEEDLAKFFPGVMLTDVEMSQLRGRGPGVVCNNDADIATCINLGTDGTLNINDNSTNASNNAISDSFEFADGILTITQFTGDGNQVDVFIQLEVNLNRVTIGDNNTGVTVTQSLDFGSLTGNLSNLSFQD